MVVSMSKVIKSIFFLILIFTGSIVYAQIRTKNLEIPTLKKGEMLIKHVAYSLVYDEVHEQAKWVAYELTAKETHKLYDRTNHFLVDPSVKTGSACDADYKGSGYDRGHLAPAADMGWSATSMTESFYFSNMSPQTPSFNRGIWKKLEELVRIWANELDTIYIVTGPVLTPGLTSIGGNKVSVPDYYYKVILDIYPTKKAIGFILPNEGSSASLKSYAVSVDVVEKMTGIDFFSLLPDNVETKVEATCCSSCWSWDVSNSSANHKSHATGDQCHGTTKAGARCRNKTTHSTGMCYLHEEGSTQVKTSQDGSKQVVQCSGITKAGNRCKRMTTDASGRCYQHQR